MEETEPKLGRRRSFSFFWHIFGSKSARRSWVPPASQLEPPQRMAVVLPREQGTAEARRLLDELDRRISALPVDNSRGVELLWAVAAELTRIGRLEQALLLWSTLRRLSDRHCAAVVPIATAAATDLAQANAAMLEPRAALRRLVLVEALDAVREDRTMQESLIAPFEIAGNALLPDPAMAARLHTIDALLASGMLPDHAARQLRQWRSPVSSRLRPPPVREGDA